MPRTPQEFAARSAYTKDVGRAEGLATLQGQTDIQTGAQQALAGQQGDIAKALSAQQAAGQKALTEQQARYAEALSAQEAAQALTHLSAQFAGQGQLQQAQQAAQLAQQKQAEAAQSAYLSQQATIQTAAERRRMEALKGLMGQFTGDGGGDMEGEDPMPSPEDPALTVANQAALGQAKNTAGQIGGSAVRALQSAAAGRGLGRSGIATGEIANVLQTGAGQIGAVNQQGLQATLENQRQTALQNAQLSTTRRGQNLSLLGQALGGLTSARAY